MSKKIVNHESQTVGFLTHPDKRLHQESREYRESDSISELNKILHGMLFDKPRAQGLSLVQAGMLIRGCILNVKGKITIMYNPRIVRSLGKWRSLEGCISVSDRYFKPRPIFTKVEFIGEDGIKQVKWFGRRYSRIISHEIDHMNGILISDGGKRWWGSNYEKKHS